VSVTVVLDKSNRHARSSQAAYLHLNGIEPLLDHNHAIAHNKVMTIDEQEVITGSFNFTVEAENDNAENLLILQDCAALAAAYAANIAVHVAHARTYGSES
ncbi:MAG: hypothetical protein JOZ57_06145, partial [Abitibacteriaceae bacterium]|nr:hypothetical protein [Abditibacteriaceae bacterium]